MSSQTRRRLRDREALETALAEAADSREEAAQLRRELEEERAAQRRRVGQGEAPGVPAAGPLAPRGGPPAAVGQEGAGEVPPQGRPAVTVAAQGAAPVQPPAAAVAPQGPPPPPRSPAVEDRFW